MSRTVSASVVVPTVGRPQLLRRLLDSLARCDPLPAEILVVDQSGDEQVARAIHDAGARLVRSTRTGAASAMNLGLQEARHEIVLFTDDDCTVAPDWISSAYAQMKRDHTVIVTGRVLPFGDPLSVPSTKDANAPQDYTGDVTFSALYSGNMALGRSTVLSFGGFDERLLVAYDNDFCYRWLRAGRSLRYEPAMVVWHNAWRTRPELEALYVAYARGQGAFYAKHLRGGDVTLLPSIAGHLYAGVRSLGAAVIKRRPAWADSRRGILRGLPAGFVEGWRTFGRDEPAHRLTDGHVPSVK